MNEVIYSNYRRAGATAVQVYSMWLTLLAKPDATIYLWSLSSKRREDLIRTAIFLGFDLGISEPKRHQSHVWVSQVLSMVKRGQS